MDHGGSMDGMMTEEDMAALDAARQGQKQPTVP